MGQARKIAELEDAMYRAATNLIDISFYSSDGTTSYPAAIHLKQRKEIAKTFLAGGLTDEQKEHLIQVFLICNKNISQVLGIITEY